MHEYKCDPYRSVDSVCCVCVVLHEVCMAPYYAEPERPEKQIADGLAAASRGNEKLEAAQLKVTEELQAAREQAQEIIDLANKRAGQIVDEAKEQAREEAERVKTAAQADIEQELNRAREALRAQVAVLAVTGAERILGKNLDESANSRLVDDLVAEL